MSEQAKTSGATKGIVGSVLAATGIYILSPVAVAVIMGQVPPGSPLARVIDTIYPSPVGNQLIDTPVPLMQPSAVATATPTVAAAAAPAAPADTSVAMTSTPANAPLKARVEPPALRYDDGYDVTVSTTLISGVDALPVFAMTKNSYPDGWTATIKPGNATCFVRGSSVSGLSLYRDDAEWRAAEGDISRLGKDVGAQVSAVFSCDAKVREGDLITMTTRVQYLANGKRVPITLYSPALVIGPRH